MHVRILALAACCTLLAAPGLAQTSGQINHQMGEMNPANNAAKPAKALASPAATAEVTLNGKSVAIHYGAPSLRGRKMVGGHDPYGKVWRTGANEATTLITESNLKIGGLEVPAGTYTLFTLPNADQWLLIVSKKTGEWGIPYPEGDDLGRTPMQSRTLPASQEKMSISFENTKGNATEMHVKWDKADEYVSVTAE